MNRKLFLVTSIALLLFSNIDAQSTKQILNDYFQKNNKSLKASKQSGSSDFVILNEDQSQSLNANIVNVQQTFNGRRIVGAYSKAIIRNSKVISEKNQFVSELNLPLFARKSSSISETDLATILGITLIKKKVDFPDVYFVKDGNLILAKEYFIHDANSTAKWHVIIDANSMEVLSKENMTISCSHLFNDHSDNENKVTDLPSSKIEINNTLQTNAPIETYRVLKLPIEAPTFGSFSLVSQDANPIASPLGWHDDGTKTYSITRGNNVFAYEDISNKDIPGYSPDGGASRSFDFPYAYGASDNPYSYKDASITNLFYMNNKIHDIFYKFGFTESARNFQTNNFGKGGWGGDAVFAEAFDGSGLDNANFYSGYEVTIDGVDYLDAPAMQMYVWSRPDNAMNPISRYKYNSPASLLSRPKLMTATGSYGVILFDNQSVTGDLAFSPTNINGCNPFSANSLSGKIALIERGGTTSTGGSCTFAIKLKNAYDAGAVGTIIYNNIPNVVSGMTLGDSNNPAKIPAIMMPQSEGQFLKSEMEAGTTINLTLQNDYSGFKDSSLDNGVVIHEYGHGISNRLTGIGYDCLNMGVSIEQMGEGWSDYFALMLTTRPGDTSALSRSIGSYVAQQGTTGSGIRLAKYSPDFSVNNYTYANMKTINVSEHEIGFLWATMLWDLTWKYIEKYGYNADVTADPTSGNARALQTVVDGLKLQVCNPSFVDGRDAIIEADKLLTNGENKCMIWSAFAKRGLGVKASPGAKNSMRNETADFTIPTECNATLETQNIKNDKKINIFPNPTYGDFFVGNLKSSGKAYVDIYDMGGRLIKSETIETSSPKAISTQGLAKGVYFVKILQEDKIQTEKLIVK